MTVIPAFTFASARTACRLVAGVPAAARLARSFAEAGVGAQLVLVLADGGSLDTLTRAEIEAKFMANLRHGGWDAQRGDAALHRARGLYDGPIDLQFLRA